MKDIGVLVGYGDDYAQNGRVGNSQAKIVEALKNAGYKTFKVDEDWPRDTYVNFKDKYVERGTKGVSGNVFGEGGDVQRGTDYILVSDTAYCFDKFKDESSDADIVSEGRKYHDARIHVAPTSSQGHGHIDMFTLLLPKAGLLFYDKHFGKGANDNNKYNQIAEAEGLEFIEYDGNQDGVWYPLNAAVLPHPKGEAVLVDRHARSLISELVDRDIKVIPVDMPQIQYPAGKLNCQTNTFNIKDKRKVMSFFD